jgi:hypothetical protein|tara:strand:+ start:2902 stop:3525 length:624 start_codon:yes stop_codon:yes gene_type:complete
MAVPSSGAIHLSKIANEKHFDNYNQAQLPTPPYSLKDVSLGGSSNGSGVSFDLTNTANLNANKPDQAAPYAMSEFYKYDHAPSLSTSPLSQSLSSSSHSNKIVTVNHPNSSTWYVSSKPSWVTITQGSTSSSSPSLGSVNQCKYSVEANSGSTRTGDLTITLNVGTQNGSHPNGTNSTTTRTTALSQTGSNSGGGGGGGGGRGLGTP